MIIGENIFDTPERFKKALEEILFPENIPAAFEHEIAHYKQARQLGYASYFIIRISKDGRTYVSSVKTKEEVTLPEHKIAILLAPKNPSEADYAAAEEAQLDLHQQNSAINRR